MSNDYLSGLMLFANLATVQDIQARLYEPPPTAWIEGEGLRFVSLNDSSFAVGLRQQVRELDGSTVDFRKFVEAVDINLIEVTGHAKPHHHEGSDVVLRCISQDSLCRIFSTPVGLPHWHPARYGELIVLPRGTVHGFDRQGPVMAPFRLVDFNYPPLGDEDVVYHSR